MSELYESSSVFRLEGAVWEVYFRGRAIRLQDGVGFRLLAELLRRPGEEVEAPRLVSADVPASAADAERARVRVTRAVRSAIARIRVHHPDLAEHLQATIRTGAKCAYAPDPRIGPQWSL